MKTIEKKENKLVFTTDLDSGLVNAIRRYTFEVPVVAIKEVEISKNDSALYDETIAHRLGLVPLVSPKVVGKNKEFKLSLATKKEGFVTSENLTGDLKPAFDKIPITSLNKGQEIKLTATASLGTGKEHSKFTPGFMIYRDVVDIKIDKGCPKEVVEACPNNLFIEEGGKIKVDNSLACDSCGVCVEAAKKSGKDCIGIFPTGKLLVTIESFGQITPENIFIKAVDALKSDLAQVAKLLK